MKHLNLNTVILLLGLVLFIVMASLQTAEPNYQQTWYSKSKQPFAGYALHPILQSYGLQEVTPVYLPLEKKQEEGNLKGTLVLVGNTLNLSPADWQVLKAHVQAGNQALLAGNSFPEFLKDSLGFELQLFNAQWRSGFTFQETLEREIGLEFNVNTLPKRPIRVSALAAWNEFTDSLATQNISYPYQNLALNEKGLPVARSYQIGQGELLLSSTPLLLSNYFLMDKPSMAFTQGLLSWLKPQALAQHFEYYQVGSIESQSPLRFFLQNSALKTAVYLAVAGILLYFVFASKRRQRPIPTWVPTTNQSLRFVKTLATLHYRTANYSSLAQKRWQYFTDFVYKHYRIRLKANDAQGWEELKARSNAPEKIIAQLQTFRYNAGPGLKKEQLFTQEKILNTFYKHTL